MRCKELERLVFDQSILAVAQEYLKCSPVLDLVAFWWSLPYEGKGKSEAAQMYHFDMDRIKFIKFFFYLTDVDDESGPHAMVRGTHSRKRLGHQVTLRRFTDEEIERAYGLDHVVTIRGDAGAGFAEDTGCIHKGIPPRTRDRLALQIEFGLRDYALAHDERPPSQLRRIV